MLVQSDGHTKIEILFANLTLLLTVGFFAYILNNISMILEEINKKKKLYHQDLEALVRYFDL